MKTVKIKDKEFELFLTQEVIEKAIDDIAEKLNKDLAGKDPLFICVLNGSFMYASELMKRVTVPSEVSFVKMSSYQGTSSSGKLKEIYGLEEDITDRTIVIVEDIVDTGATIVELHKMLTDAGADRVIVCTLLLKPDAYKRDIPIEYVAMEIPNDFIVGYGLDYDELGRQYKDIYVLDTPSNQ